MDFSREGDQNSSGSFQAVGTTNALPSAGAAGCASAFGTTSFSVAAWQVGDPNGDFHFWRVRGALHRAADSGRGDPLPSASLWLRAPHTRITPSSAVFYCPPLSGTEHRLYRIVELASRQSPSNCCSNREPVVPAAAAHWRRAAAVVVVDDEDERKRKPSQKLRVVPLP